MSASSPPYFIIEHPTRGTLKDIDGTVAAGARFSYTGLRTNEETARRFASPHTAAEALKLIAPGVRAGCKILACPGPNEYEWLPVDATAEEVVREEFGREQFYVCPTCRRADSAPGVCRNGHLATRRILYVRADGG